MDYQKMYGILIFLAGIVMIAGVAGIGLYVMLDLIRHNQAKWKKLRTVGDSAAELEELRARVEDLERRGLVSGEVESQYARLAELEERLDFAERLLAQRNVSPTSPNGGIQ
jgi:cell shape-determining protein MreC